MRLLRFLIALLVVSFVIAKDKKPKVVKPTPLEQYLKDALSRSGPPSASPGSLWTPASRLVDLGSDVRASQVDDLVTIVVSEQASAVVQGATNTQRQSNLQSGITALAGVPQKTAALPNLVTLATNAQLQGQGTTSRSTQLSTTLSARVTNVLPNGYLVIEASKAVGVNSEHQVVTLRGVVRPADLSVANTVTSNQIAQMELQIDGKGVVNDAIRRPNFLYRFLMGLLPF
jgi:flagellar L-ring protein FlgH